MRVKNLRTNDKELDAAPAGVTVACYTIPALAIGGILAAQTVLLADLSASPRTSGGKKK